MPKTLKVFARRIGTKEWKEHPDDFDFVSAMHFTALASIASIGSGQPLEFKIVSREHIEDRARLVQEESCNR